MQTWQQILGSGDQAACLVDKDVRILGCNAAMESFVGRKTQQLVGLSCCRAVHGDEGMVANCPLARMRQSHRVEKGLVTISGRCFEVAVYPFFEKSGKISHIVHTFTDLAHASSARKAMLRLQCLEHVDEISRGLAHDLNNVLSTGMGVVGILRSQQSDPSGLAEIIEGMEQAMFRGTKLCKQLMMAGSNNTPSRSVVSLSSTIKESSELATTGSGLTLTTRVDEDLWPCLAHEGQIAQVVINLVMNARQASDTGGIVRVEAQNFEGAVAHLGSGKFVKIVVEDRGDGIPPENMSRIFEPFFTTKESGTGLGLAAVDLIIRQHMGHIEVKSEVGSGTTVTVHLPAFDPESVSAQNGRTFAQVLQAGSFCLDLKSDTKEGIIEELIDTIASDGKIRDRKAALAAVLARENSMPTGMQDGVALPHGKTNGVNELVVAIGLQKKGVDFGSLDGQPCRIFVMTISPLQYSGPHAKYLADISKALGHHLRRKQVLEAANRDEIVRILTN